MSPELETLDQLLGGPLALPIIRGLFGDPERFARALASMLAAGDVRLVDGEDVKVPQWRWQEVLTSSATEGIYRVHLTDCGARRIG